MLGKSSPFDLIEGKLPVQLEFTTYYGKNGFTRPDTVFHPLPRLQEAGGFPSLKCLSGFENKLIKECVTFRMKGAKRGIYFHLRANTLALMKNT